MNPASRWLAARNLLSVRMDNIGDVLMLGPALRAIKETSPEARITLLASPAGSTAVPLLPWIDEVIVWRASWQDVGNRVPFDPAQERELIDILAARNFDAALIFSSFSQTPHVPGYVCYLAGIPLRAGESKEFGGNTLSDGPSGTPESTHQVERNLWLIESVGFPVRDRQLAVRISDAARAALPRLLASAGIDESQPYVLLHPGASAPARRYPPERFGRIARLLLERGRQVLVTGVEREQAVLEVVLAEAPRAARLTGGASLEEYAALVERAQVVICNDSLPLHLADAIGTPEIVLFSGTDYEEQWAPRKTSARLLRQPTPCSPCYRFECPIGLLCLDISPETVVSEVESLARKATPLGGVA